MRQTDVGDKKVITSINYAYVMLTINLENVFPIQKTKWRGVGQQI